jgi:hypothetical protein
MFANEFGLVLVIIVFVVLLLALHDLIVAIVLIFELVFVDDLLHFLFLHMLTTFVAIIIVVFGHMWFIL